MAFDDLDRLINAGTGPATLSYAAIRAASGLNIENDAVQLMLKRWADEHLYAIANDDTAKTITFTKKT
jgi:hypothetical protein